MGFAEQLEAIAGKNAEQQDVKVWLDTGFAPLNKAISGNYKGGLPSGRVVEMFGGSSCGKTAIATKAMISAQQQGGIAIFNDHERTFALGLAIDLGLDPERFIFKQPKTFEESIDNTFKYVSAIRQKGLIADTAPIVVTFDSLASMIPHSKYYDSKNQRRDSESFNMHDNTALARATSACFPMLADAAIECNMLLLFLNQIRTKPGVAYGDPTTTPGGNAPEYYSSVRISLTRSMVSEGKGADKKVLGQDIRAFIKKNKVSAPFQEAFWRFNFREDGSGYFDTITSTLQYAKDKGLIEAAGAYLVWGGKKYHMGQLAEKIEAEGSFSEVLDLLYASES